MYTECEVCGEMNKNGEPCGCADKMIRLWDQCYNCNGSGEHDYGEHNHVETCKSCDGSGHTEGQLVSLSEYILATIKRNAS